MTDFPDWQAPQAHANAISTTGAPPLVLKRVVDVLIGQNVPALGTVTRPASGAFSINQPGYEIQINVATLGGTAPACSVELQWFDSSFGGLVDDEVYYFLSGNLNGHLIHGRGPSKGDQVVAIIKNYDPTSAVTFSYTLLQTSRVFTREFWKTTTKGGVNPVFPGFTATPQNLPANVLCAQSVSVPASGSSSFMLPLYTGTVRLIGSASATVGTQQWEVIDVTEQVAGAQTFSVVGNGETGYAPNGPGSAYLPDVPLPRAQCKMTLINTATTAQIMNTNIIAKEDRA